jgi:Helicase conserved C-terminal domain
VAFTPTATGQAAGFSVANALAGCADDRLCRLLETRPDLAGAARSGFAALASRVDAWPSVRACVRDLSQLDRQVIEGLCLLPQPTTASSLAMLLGGVATEANLAAPLARLADRALLFFQDGGRIQLLPVLELLEFPARLGPPVAAALGGRTVGQLSEVAHRLDLAAGPTKAATLARIAAALANPARVRALLAGAPTGTKELADRAAHHGPSIPVPDVHYLLRHGKTADTPVGWLVSVGMLATTDYGVGVMPREVGLALRGGRPFPNLDLRPPPLRVTNVGAEEVDRLAGGRAMSLVNDIAAMLEAWGDRPVKLLKSGGLGVREVRRLAAAINRPEGETARLVELAGVARLAAEHVDIPTAMPTTTSDDWLALPAPARWAWLAAAWLDANLQVGAAGCLDEDDKPIPPLLGRRPERDAARRRRLVLDVLRELEPGRAADLDSLRRRLVWEAPGIWDDGPTVAAELVQWIVEEAELVGLAAHGALSGAGWLAVAGDRDGAAAAVARWAPEVTDTFVVQADLTAVVAGDLDPAVRRELELLATVESKGVASVYRFSEESLRRAFDAGRTAESIDAFLGRHAERGVPQPLRYVVADVARRFGQVRVGAAKCYLRCDDPALVAEILRAKRAASLRLRQIAPTVLLCDADPAAVLGTLRKAGYLPARESADGSVLAVGVPAHRTVPPPAAGNSADGIDDFTLAMRALIDPDLAEALGVTVVQPAAAPVQPADAAGLVAQLRRSPPPTVDAEIQALV